MSPLTESTRLTLAKTYVGIDDPDAAAYITAVEAADTAAGQSGGLETATRVAIHSFVKGCKSDGIWPAIKASCILSGARTRLGALVPLVGPTPTNFNFVDADYDRKLGLLGNGSNKRLASGYQFAGSNLNNAHLAAYASSLNTVLSTGALVSVGAGTELRHGGSGEPTSIIYQSNNTDGSVNVGTSSAGLYGWSRSTATTRSYRYPSTTVTGSSNSTGVQTDIVSIFARSNATIYGAHRLAFYSIGESLDLALLSTRVSALITAFGVAIP
jgi:hypothetical protein